ncbi:hypothetical protein SEA_GILGAMESH_135 [Streptomyces phage Gilgamesh]|uniref:Uncharacterized protein n=1 Tax=Streptomyces phage Gilgamesh TaxID=2599890 RepID=A0A5J6TTS1_9CAUD|nr:hypothetical protein QEH35_gp135 [Streptomyces phage Gilgamesh]QFG13327.1 hypothetical protein SEA_GILGAMESH_135 [Streptomyces phage Gilgamesh]
MPAANLTPVSVLDDALAQARTAARAVLALVAETLHHQFPTGAYLVLTRPSDDAYDVDGDGVTLDSVRDDQGETVQDLDPYSRGTYRLPAVPDDIAALWGSTDPRNPSAVNDLIQRIDGVSPYTFLDFLPLELRTAEEVQAEDDGGRTPLGLPLRPQTGA